MQTHTINRYTKGIPHYRNIWKYAMHLQTQAVASLALFGGLRNQEIRLVDIDEIHPDNEFVVVSNGKGGRGGRQGFREVPYTEQGRRMVAEWLEFRAMLGMALNQLAHNHCYARRSGRARCSSSSGRST